MSDFIDSDRDPLVEEGWYEIVPDNFPYRFTGRVEPHPTSPQAIFEGYLNDGRVSFLDMTEPHC